MFYMGRPTSQTDIYKAIADPTRRAVLKELSFGEKSVTDLHRPLAISMPALSGHLQILREVHLVKQERKGKQRIYHLNAKPLQEVSQWLAFFEQFWDTKLDELAIYLASVESKQPRVKPSKK